MNRRAFLTAIAGAAVAPNMPTQELQWPVMNGICTDADLRSVLLSGREFGGRQHFMIARTLDGDRWCCVDFDHEPFPLLDDCMLWEMSVRNRIRVTQLKVVEFKGKRFVQWIHA